jgi:BASS family bile acid:Na+ symporter
MVAVIPLSEGVRTGLIILSLAAGAPFLPKLAAIAKSDTAFAIGQMLLLMTVTIFYLPLVLPLLLSGAEVSPGAIARSLVVMMLIPLLAGLGVRARFRAAAERARPVFARISNIALLVMTATLLILHGGSLIDLFGFGVLAIILLLLAAVALGWFLGGPGRGTRVVLSLGTGQRNISAGIIVASQNFPDPDVTLTLIAAAILGLVIMLPAAGKLSRGKT